MAKHQKTQPPPVHTIEAPIALVPLMQAFHVDSEGEAKALISEAARAIYGAEGKYGTSQIISNIELNGIVSLMKAIDPKDSIETLYAAQIVVSHMLGMRKLSESHSDDQKLGLNLLRFSNEAMQYLVRKRSGGMKNITVNYHHNVQSNALMQTVIKDKGTI